MLTCLFERFNNLEDVLTEIKKLGISAIPNRKQEQKDAEGDDDSLWCPYCIDDASIPLCAFCGCKVSLSRSLTFVFFLPIQYYIILINSITLFILIRPALESKIQAI
jgi:hypothetical protein